MAGKSITFLPGSEPGPIASGHPMDDRIMKRALERLGMDRMPVGNKVTERHPWLRTATITVKSGENPSHMVKIVNGHDEPWALNNSGREVHIEEVRIRVNPPMSGSWPVWFDEFLQVRMEIPPRRQIIERWVPWKVLNTSIGRFVGWRINEYTFVLPAPYFLDRSNPFTIDVAYHTAFANWKSGMESLFDMVLQGWGVEDGEPIHLVKHVPPFPPHLAVVDAHMPVTFDDDMDRTLRSAYITHIGFGGAYLGAGTQAATPDIVRVRFRPPEGKIWDSGEFFSVVDVAEQMTFWVLNEVPNSYTVVHRPMTPYVLFPGEHFHMSFYIPNDWGSITKNVTVTLIGTQEVEPC